MMSPRKQSKSSRSSRKPTRRAGSPNAGRREEDRLDYRLEHHPEFLRRVAEARSAIKDGRGVRLEDLPS